MQVLTDLSQNNDRDWFEANRARYQAVALSPSKDFVEAIGPRLQGLDPDLGCEAKVNGSLFRINRDTRFSQDKRPYKEEPGFRFFAGTDRKAPRSSLLMRITSEFVGFGAGM